MYQYEYVSVEGKLMKDPCFWGYRQIIDEYAAKGWRYAGYVPTAITGEGRIYKIDLIFEKECREEEGSLTAK